jgi:hypothetical protein
VYNTQYGALYDDKSPADTGLREVIVFLFFIFNNKKKKIIPLKKKTQIFL